MVPLHVHMHVAAETLESFGRGDGRIAYSRRVQALCSIYLAHHRQGSWHLPEGL